MSITDRKQARPPRQAADTATGEDAVRRQRDSLHEFKAERLPGLSGPQDRFDLGTLDGHGH